MISSSGAVAFHLGFQQRGRQVVARFAPLATMSA
jgi:hypothetical protein